MIKEKILKLADFGASKEAYDNDIKHTPFQGTIGYLSPEMRSVGSNYDFKTDIWYLFKDHCFDYFNKKLFLKIVSRSTGCIIYELIFLEKYANNADLKTFSALIPKKLLRLLKM